MIINYARAKKHMMEAPFKAWVLSIENVFIALSSFLTLHHEQMRSMQRHNAFLERRIKYLESAVFKILHKDDAA